ncbi:MAG: alpha-E domain-containing protein, partial [Sedimenticolaceae bacterium]
MLSRVAENLYWLGRYLERAENTARLIQVTTHLQLDLPTTVKTSWTSLLDIFAIKSLFDQ